MARSVEKRIEVLEKLYGTDTRARIGLKGGGKSGRLTQETR
jgi:hypothetical protein